MRALVALTAIAVTGCAAVPPGAPRPAPSTPPSVQPTSASPSRPATPSPPPSPSASRSGSPTTSPSTSPESKPAEDTLDCSRLKCVALTFDDGPVPGTADLLDVLEEKDAHATFFVLGSLAKSRPKLLRRMVKEGHAVGNHSYSHALLTRLGKAAVSREVTRTSDVIRKATGSKPRLLRPPYGATNSVVRSVARSEGLTQILWSVDPLDWKDRNSTIVSKRIVSAARPGSIILAHDSRPTTRDACKRIIDGLRKKGFTLVTVPELLGSKRLKPGVVVSKR